MLQESTMWVGPSEAVDEGGSEEDEYDKALVRYAIACLATLATILKLPVGPTSQVR